MNRALRVIGIILCALLIIVDLVFLAPAAIGLIGASQGNGTRLGLAFADQSAGVGSAEEIKQIIKLLGARLEKLGISNAIIEPSEREGIEAKGEVIQVLLPPKTNVEEAKRLLTYVALLEFKLVAKGTDVPYEKNEQAEAARRDLQDGQNRYTVIRYTPRDGSGVAVAEGWIIVEKTPVITSTDIQNAEAARSQYGASIYEIGFQLTPAAANRFARVTRENVGNHLAIILNYEVKSAPIIQSEINDRGQITGGFTQQSAEDLALILRSGALPRPLHVVSEQPVDGRRWSGGFLKRTVIFALPLVVLLAILYKLARARPSTAEVYWPQLYGQSRQ